MQKNSARRRSGNAKELDMQKGKLLPDDSEEAAGSEGEPEEEFPKECEYGMIGHVVLLAKGHHIFSKRGSAKSTAEEKEV